MQHKQAAVKVFRLLEMQNGSVMLEVEYGRPVRAAAGPRRGFLGSIVAKFMVAESMPRYAEPRIGKLRTRMQEDLSALACLIQ